MNERVSAVVGVLVCVHLVAVLAGFFAPYSYREQNRTTPRAAPTQIRFIDDEGRWHARPIGIYEAAGNEAAGNEAAGNEAAGNEAAGNEAAGSEAAGSETVQIVPLSFFVRGSSYELLGLVRSDLHLFGVDEPHRVFVLGTDSLGRDYFSRLLYGGQLSLMAGLMAAVLALATALVLGAAAGYGGRGLDRVIMWTGDVFLSLPWLYMLLAARAFLPLDMDPGEAFLVIVMLLGVLGWAAPMRIVRGIVLSAKEREFVTAARSAGAGHVHILARHILPQTTSVLLTQAALLIPAYMLAEVTLSFVGLGVGEPRPSWGNMLAELPRTSVLSQEPWTFAPAVLVVVVTWLYHSALSSRQR